MTQSNMELPADLLLTNARVLTMDDRLPHARAVAARGDTIIALGETAGIASFRGHNTRVIDCQGLTLLPGFVDAHCHLLALAGSLTGIDCSSGRVGSIDELKREFRLRAEQTPAGRWIRGYGYDEGALLEARHPTRWDLDAAAPGHPVRLDHRSGHAAVLNSLGLELAAIYRDTPDPVDGVIQRDEPSGEPTGLLLEMEGFLRNRLGTTRDQYQFDLGVSRLNEKLLEYGITSVQDAGPNNGLDRWATFQRLKESAHLAPRVSMMAGASQLGEFLAAGMDWGAEDDQLKLGHAKIVLTMTTGALQPDIDQVGRLLSYIHNAGFPAAVHAVEEEAVLTAARALSGQKGDWRRCTHRGNESTPPDRIEHASECPPELGAAVKASGAMVVTQPGFIYWNGDRYRSDVRPQLLPYLYAVGALSREGVPLAFGSDAPVIDPNPWPGIGAAVTRLTRTGQDFTGGGRRWPDQRVPVLDALKMYTVNGARSEGTQQRKGSIRPGKLADLVLVDADPLRVDPSELQKIKAVLTVLGGEVVWER